MIANRYCAAVSRRARGCRGHELEVRPIAVGLVGPPRARRTLTFAVPCLRHPLIVG